MRPLFDQKLQVQKPRTLLSTEWFRSRGQVKRGGEQPIELKALSYFRHQTVDPKEALGCGVAQKKFNSYLSEFLYFKFGEVEEGSGGRSLDYSTVVAVSSNGEITHCEGLASYCERMNLGPDLTPDPGPTSNPGFDMGGPS